MSLAKPELALGLDIPNPTFSLADEDDPTNAAGWVATNSTLTAGKYSGLPDNGHHRAQEYGRTTTGTFSVLSAPATPRKGIAETATKYCAFVWHRGPTLSTTRAVKLQFFDSAGAWLATQSIGELTGSASWLAEVIESSSITPPSGSHHIRLYIEYFSSVSAPWINLAFACPGIWDGSTESYKVLSDYFQVGTEGRLQNLTKPLENAYGQHHYNDRLQFVNPHKLEIVCDRILASDRDVWHTAFSRFLGHGIDASSLQNPGGGMFPLLLKPGNPNCPGVGLYDFTDKAFPLKAADAWIRDRPLATYSGTINLRERL